MKNHSKKLVFALLATLVASLLFNYFIWRRYIRDIPSTDNTCHSCPNTNPYQPVSNIYLRQLLTNYKNNHWNTLNNSLPYLNSMGRQDSRSVWFDLNTVKNFIADIETKASINCGDHCDQGLGIRIYFGEYDTRVAQDTAMNRAISHGYGGLHTLVMIPTKRDTNARGTPREHVDFDATLMTRMNGCDPRRYTDSMSTIMALTAQLPLDMMNHGTLIPPPNSITDPCTGATFMHYIDVRTCP